MAFKIGDWKPRSPCLDCKKWPTNVCVECVESKLENMQDFLSSKVVLIEENKKLIEEKGLFEEDYDDI